MAPAIGLLMSTASEITAKVEPFLTPILVISGEIWAMSAGAMETKAPEPKPYKEAKIIKPGLSCQNAE